jgi:alanine racemase
LLDLDEAVRVRQLGWKKPILLLGGIFNCNDAKVAEEFDLTVAVPMGCIGPKRSARSRR